MRTFALFSCLWAASCTCFSGKSAPDSGPTDAGPEVLSEREPNDGPNAALTVSGSAFIEANLSADPKAPDEDWYVFTSPLPRTLTIKVTVPPKADVALELVDATKTVLARVDSAGPGGTETLTNVDVSGKTLMRVVQVSKGAGGAYLLQAIAKDRRPGFELEPNERLVDATRVPLGQAISGFVGHGNDVDLFRYELPQEPADEFDAGEFDAGEDDGGLVDAGAVPEKRVALRVDVSGVAGVAFELKVLTEAEAVLFSASAREGQGISLRNVGARAKDAVLFVQLKATGKDPKGQPDGGRGANSTSYYTLTVAPEDTQGSSELEPNDEGSKATTLPMSGTREGFVTPKGDVDYYELNAEGPVVTSVSLSAVEGVDLTLSMVDPAAPETVLLKVNEGGTKEPEQLPNVSCANRCLFRIEATARKIDGKWVRDDANGDVPYQLTTSSSPDDGTVEREPNNERQRSTLLMLGKPVRGTVFPKKDVDYFQLDLSSRPVKTPVNALLTGILKVDVGLYLHRIEADGTLSLVQTADGAKGDKPERLKATLEPGTYLFEVRDAKGREANFQDAYQLSVDEGDE
jgi:hypothetical protein